MPIPDYQTLMLPVLRFAGTKVEYHLSEIVEALGLELQLSQEEKDALLPAGTQRTFVSRVSWAQTYLKKAQLLESRGRGNSAITQRGQQMLAQNPLRIDNKFLRQFQEFIEFEGVKATPADSDGYIAASSQEDSELDPLEAFNQSYLSIRQNLSDDLLEMLKRTKPVFFEKLVVDLLVAMGYGGSDEEIRRAAMKGSSDQGIDGIIKEDILGLSHIYLQAKRWKDSVGRPVVQSFAGSMDLFHATKGVMITTSTFTDEARQYIRHIGKTLILIDGKQLVQLMLDHGVGVKTVESYQIQAIDAGYYEMEDLGYRIESV